MPQEPDNYELAREIERLRMQADERFRAVDQRFERFLSREIYDESQKRQGERWDGFLERLSAIEKLLGRINTIAWTGVVLPIAVALITALLVYAVVPR